MNCRRGRIHQGMPYFFDNYAGRQCVVMAVVALGLLSLQTGNLWEQKNIDEVIQEGHVRYIETILLRNIAPRCLQHNEVPRSLPNLLNIGVDIGIELNENYYGVVGQDSDINSGSTDLVTSLSLAFSNSNFVLATFSDYSIGINYSPVSGSYFLFDSHSCGSHGERGDPFGSAVLVEFYSFRNLVNYLTTMYSSNAFELTALLISHERNSHPTNSPNRHASLFQAVPLNESFAIQSSNTYNSQTIHANTKFTRNHEDTNERFQSFHSVDNKKTHHGINKSEMTSRRKKRKGEEKGNCELKTNEPISVNMRQNGFNIQMSQQPLQDLTEILMPNFFQHSTCVNRKDGNNTEIICVPIKSKPYLREIQMKPEFKCFVCMRFLFKNQVFKASSACEEYGVEENATMCQWCSLNIRKGKFCVLSFKKNNLDVGEMPLELRGLNVAEKRCISKLNTFFSLVILPAFPVGQMGMRGLVIHLPLPVNEVANILPRIQTENDVAYIYPSEVTKVPSVINVKKICNALKWLKLNNPLYKDIDISGLRSSEHVHMNNSEQDVNVQLEEIGTIDIDYSIPSDTAIVDAHFKYTLPVQTNENLINITKIDNGEELAFPHLFPYGKFGISAVRPKKLTLLQYYKSRLYNIDPRWRCDISYLLSSVNTYEKERLFQLVSIYMKVKKVGNSDHQLRAKDISSHSLLNNPELAKNSYMFMKSIRGTAAYWKDILLNLLAMVKNLGSPTLFMTLSANDYHWPELADMLHVPISELPQAVRDNPLMTAIHFERRWRALFKNVINGPKKPLGTVKDYFVRVEFQSRGSPHLHIFFWIENAPSLHSSSNEQLIQYIDKVISTHIPDEQTDLHQLVKKLQIHSHRKTCRRGNKCRFSFPYPPSNQTYILPAFDFTQSKKFYVTKRTLEDTMVNAYNPTILLNWQANMDIQIVNGPISVAFYVCSYVCKSEPNILKNALSETIRNIEDSAEPVSLRSRMCRIGFCILKHRTLSSQEAAYRIGHLQLTWCSRKVIRIAAFPPEKRYKRLKSQQVIDSLEPNSTEIFDSNIFDYYYSRPQMLAHASLFSFCRLYEVVSSTSKNLNFLKLNMPGEKFIKERKVPAVVRVCSPPKGTEDYFYSLLLLFFPHSHPDDLFEQGKSTQEMFVSKYLLFNQSAINIGYKLPDLEQMINTIRLATSNLSLFAPNTHENGTEPVLEESFGQAMGMSELIHEPPASEDIQEPDFIENASITEQSNILDHTVQTNNEDDRFWHRITTNATSHHDFVKTLSTLTTDQKTVVDYVTKCFKNHQTCNIFITGGAGVGKSFLIKVLVNFLKLYTTTYVEQNPVLIMAPTGVAAHNVHGQTIHSALKIPVQHSYGDDEVQLSSRVLKCLQSEYKQIHTIIIDEVSMVSSRMLEFINNRLQSIRNNNLPFGGLHVILVGDFFQLKPVKGQFAFKHKILWPLFKPLFLRQNMRQASDEVYAQVLNRIRVGTITNEDMSLLRGRLSEKMPFNASDCLHIFPTRDQVQQHNMNVQRELHENPITINALHYFSERDIDPNGEVTDEDLIPLDDRDAGGLPISLTISLLSKVMLLRNIALKYGLVNGARGIVTKIETNSVTNQVDYIFVRFEGVQLPQGCLSDGDSVIISRYKQEFLYRGRMIIRETFPLAQCWAATVHKVQGLSLLNAAISLDSNIFQHGQAYVALSRVCNHNSLYLLSLCFHKITADPEVAEEYLRLFDIYFLNSSYK